jgi:Leucine-rich repeat (LRR) protein
MSKLKWLNISGCKRVKDWDNLSKLSNLVRLIITDNDITDLSCLSKLIKLEELDISKCNKVNKLPDLRITCPNLEFLDISDAEFLAAGINQTCAYGKDCINRMFVSLDAAGKLYTE